MNSYLITVLATIAGAGSLLIAESARRHLSGVRLDRELHRFRRIR